MYRLTEQNGRTTYETISIVVDTYTELVGMSISGIGMGSTAYAIDTGKTYILSGSGSWVEKKDVNVSSSTGSSSGSSTTTTGTITFQIRRGLSSAFKTNNPVLAQGEPAYELDTHRMKIGDGVTAYNSLSYIAMSTLTIGDKKYNGSEDVTILSYGGVMKGD